MLVSVIINNYNYARFLREAIDSALGQTYPYTEVIVVDDGSTDGSREIIGEYGDRVIPVLKENGGQASAINAGFEASHGEVVCLLDSDDVFVPCKAAEVVAVFDEHKDVGSCFHPVRWEYSDGALAQRGARRIPSGRYDFRVDMRQRCGGLSAPPTSGLCFRRSLLELALPMPEAEGVSISDLYLKITSMGFQPIFYLDKELTLQGVHSGNRYTLRKDRRLLTARIHMLAGYWIRRRFPELSPCANRLFARGVGYYMGAGGIEPEYKPYVRRYWSTLQPDERLAIYTRVFYHGLRSRVRNSRN